MKILILVIYSNNQEYYEKMLKIQRKYVHKYENVEVFFVQSSFEHNEEVFVDNDMIYVRSNEENNTILYKTLYAMQNLTQSYKKEYDFIIRTNISTLIDIPKLLELLSLFKDIEYLYAGELCGFEICNRHIWFALGTSIILSKKLANKMIDEIYKFNHNIPDDVAFGLFVEENIPIAYNHNLSMCNLVFYTNRLSNGYNSNLIDFINFEKNNNLNSICYRNSLANRDEDVNIMNYICDKIFNI